MLKSSFGVVLVTTTSIFLLLLLASFPTAHAAARLRVNPGTSQFEDQYGRVRIYHGVNVVYKLAPFYPPILDSFDPMLSFSEQDAQYLSAWGQNVIRLYISWDGFEIAPGQFNESYAETIQSIVKLCARYNISVILDLHQDLFSFYFCGEGVPNFYVAPNDTFPLPFKFDLPRNAQNYPLNKNCTANVKTFAEYYFAYDVAQFSQDLTLNVNNLTNYIARFWGEVAKRFQKAPNVIGYELLNEPWGISQYDRPVEFYYPGFSNTEYMLPFYRIINNKIREIDNDTLVFFEPIVTDFLNGGFKENVGGEAYQDREVFSYHVYCPFVNQVQNDGFLLFQNKISNGVPDSLLNQQGCAIFDPFEFGGKFRNARKIGTGAFLTEFGALLNSTLGIQELKRLVSIADQRFQSLTYWQYKYYNDITTASPSPNIEGFWDEYGNLQSNKVAVLARPYAYAICGEPILMQFEFDKEQLTLVINNNDDCGGQHTEIFLSEEFYYKKGFQVKYTDCDPCKIQKLYGSYYAILGTELLPFNWQYKIEIIAN